MLQWILLLLLPVATWSGWFLAMRRDYRKLRLDQSREAYFTGLGYLIDEQPEKAVDILLSVPDSEFNSIEGRLRLGTLFRKRGEVDKALRIHQKLFSELSGSSKQYQKLLFELGEDYRSCGMYQQAVEVFEQLLSSYSDRKIYAALIDLYEQLKNWEAAYYLAEQWQGHGYGSKQVSLGHYACELADIAHEKEEIEICRQWLDKAEQHAVSLERVHWLKARYALKEGNYSDAVIFLEEAIEANDNIISDVLPLLKEAYLKLDRIEDFIDKMISLAHSSRNIRIMSLILHELRTLACTDEIVELLKQVLPQNQHPLLLKEYYDAGLLEYFFAEQFPLLLLPQIVYQCKDCGFQQQQRHWHCPSCRSWNTFVAVYRLEIEE